MSGAGDEDRKPKVIWESDPTYSPRLRIVHVPPVMVVTGSPGPFDQPAPPTYIVEQLAGRDAMGTPQWCRLNLDSISVLGATLAQLLIETGRSL